MSSARKLVYSKIPSPSTSDTSTSTTTSTIPSIIVLENMGAARWTDVVEIYRLVQHFTHQILLSASSSSSSEQTSDTKNFCTFCNSNNSHNATLSKEIKDQISQSIHVPADSISQAVVRIPMIRTRTDENDDKYDFQQQQPVDLLWHYGWTFSVIVPNPKYFSHQQQMSMEYFCKQLQSLLSSFKPEGRRIPRGSAAQGNSKNKQNTSTIASDESNHDERDEKSQLPAITTLPVEIIATLEENIPLPDIIKLFEAASPSVKLCGFPQIEANKKKLISMDNKKPFLKSPEIPGLFMLTNFITQEEENQLLNRVATWEKQEGPNRCWQTLNLRRVRHFGRRFDYSTNNVFEDKMVPLVETPWIKTLLDKIHSAMRESKQFENLPQKEWGVDQMTVSEYTAGAGIPPHLDHPENFGEIVVAVATGAPTLFEFSKIVSSSTENGEAEEEKKNGEDAKEEENEKVSNKCSVLFPPRALMVMQGPSRYQWKHSIAARSKDYLFFLDEESPELTTNNKQDEKEGDKNRVANQYLSACSLERGRRISFTFRRVTMDEKEESRD